MPYRKTPLITDHYYHVYNRGTAKQNIFSKPKDYHRFERTAYYYTHSDPPTSFSYYINRSFKSQQPIIESLHNTPHIVEIAGYVLMPNHYHFILKQSLDKGISTFIRKLSNSYTRYVNTAQDRVGPLFQGPFKAKHIQDESQLVYLLKYIHHNPLHAQLTSSLQTFEHSSHAQYATGVESGFLPVQTKDILSLIGNHKAYEKFIHPPLNHQEHLQITPIIIKE